MRVMTTQSSLKSLLMLDATTCAVMGVVLLAASRPIAMVTQVPAQLLFWAGAVLLPVAAFMALSARATPAPAWAVGIIVLGNVLWVAASIFLPASGLIAPSGLGWAFLIAQAAIVALLAKLEFDALRGPPAFI